MMSKDAPASAPSSSAPPRHTALVLAGGGIMGAAYEIGCLAALDQFFGDSFSCRQFDTYLGVSAGSVIATLTANGIRPEDLFRTVVNEEESVLNWRRKDIYQFDLRSQFASVWRLLRNMTRILRHYRQNRWDLSAHDLRYILQEQFPAGIFSLQPLRSYLERAFSQSGVVTDFRQLDRQLLIPAYDLDRGSRVVFGLPGDDDVSICDAIAASSAIPFFFRPVKIKDRHYIDGTIGRTTHLDVVIRQGARLIVVINPRVPMNNDPESACLPSLSYGTCTTIAHLGIGIAWEQSQRIEHKLKLDIAMEAYRRDHPEVDILLIEPASEESLLFFQSPMSQKSREHIMTHGYHLTLGLLRDRFAAYREVFARHGIEVSTDRLTANPPVETTT